ncbi:MAG: Holliday junction branch migration protein RuvA [Cardiobacteriaceae bacterium]|nr:Holliday junction branch migration protein RuvA [Cardiobacteriaceae bacterium]
MIGYLQGQVLSKNANQIILLVGGVGYEIAVPISVLDSLSLQGQSALFIHHAQREDGQYLYGFQTLEQRTWFRELIKVSGIGPKLALLVLSGYDPSRLSTIVREQRTAELCQLPGIGKKTAERLVIELADRVGKWLPTMPLLEGQALQSALGNQARFEAEEALVALGYKPAEAAQLLAKVSEQHPDATTDTLLRQALSLKFKGLS